MATRHWYESELKPVQDLEIGDELVQRKRVATLTRGVNQMVVGYDDGTSATFDLAVDPVVDIVTAGLR